MFIRMDEGRKRHLQNARDRGNQRFPRARGEKSQGFLKEENLKRLLPVTEETRGFRGPAVKKAVHQDMYLEKRRRLKQRDPKDQKNRPIIMTLHGGEVML